MIAVLFLKYGDYLLWFKGFVYELLRSRLSVRNGIWRQRH